MARISALTLLLWSEKDAMIPIGNAADYLQLLPEPDPVTSLRPVGRFLSGETP